MTTKQRFYIVFICILFCNSVLFSQKTFPKYWLWLVDHESLNYDSVFTKLNATGIDGVLLATTVHPLKEIIKKAEQYNISIHLWRWILNTQNLEVVRQHPEWASVNRNGQNTFQNDAYVDYYRFMCPALPEVRSFILSEIQAFLETEGLLGLSLDYCRYVDVILPEKLWKSYGIVQDKEYPEWDYGYHPYTIKLFAEKYGYSPLDLEDPSLDQAWKSFREEQVTELANMIGKAVRKKGKVISASPFPSPSLARKHVRQDWASWNLDIVFPMIYNGFYKEEGKDWFLLCLEECLKAMRPKNTMVFPGLYVPGHRNTDFSLTEAMQSAINHGGDGFALFSYKDLQISEWEEVRRFILNNK